MLTQLVLRKAAGALLLVLVCSLQAAAAPPDAPPPDNVLVYRVAERKSQLSLVEKEIRLLETEGRLVSVHSFDDKVIKITQVENSANRVYLKALVPGFTTVVLVDENQQSFTVDVLVSGDVKQLEAVIRRAAPGSSVQALKVKDNVLLLGWVDQSSEATKIAELAEQFHPKVLNYLQVSGVQTIMLRVKMMEVQRSKIRSLGFNFLQSRQHSYIGSLPGPITPFASGAPSVDLGNPFGGLTGPATSSLNPAAATAVFGVVAADNAFQGFVEALQTNNLLKVLAEPTLSTTNGRPASFLDGGQFPVPVPQGLGTVSVVYKPFGVQLEFVPTVLGNGRLRMNVKPEVSEKDLSNTLVVSGIQVPSLTTRSVNTEVEMNFGETLVIAGLISNRVQATTQKVPFLGELPWIGAAFRRVRFDESENELLVLVTPELVAPTDESLLPPGPGMDSVSPTDRELYYNGVIEARRYGPDYDPYMGPQPPNYVPPPQGHSAPMGSAPSAPARQPAPPPVELPPPETGEGAIGPASAKSTARTQYPVRQTSGIREETRPVPSTRNVKAKPPAGAKATVPLRTAQKPAAPGLIAP